MGELMEGAVQQAAQPGRQFMSPLSPRTRAVLSCCEPGYGVSRGTSGARAVVPRGRRDTNPGTLRRHGAGMPSSAGRLGTMEGCPKMRQVSRGAAHALSPRI
ncbi:MAG: hypothetical protein E6Q30_03460 [Aquabacterium sp.]|nr:MAG: hypothetical protein E6Q30_03460 [Aquabacterium sp.]